jgi:hypothetical protein
MFTHPALLRQLNLCSELLRRGGEGAWARRVVQAADAIRKSGWTEAGQLILQGLFDGEPGFEALSFGAEHSSRLGGPDGITLANEKLSAQRAQLRELGRHPVKDAPDPAQPRRRSPDLA